MSADVTVATFGAATVDPLDLIPRDRWGRPLLAGPDGKVVGHTRASAAGKPLEDVTKLTEWKERQVSVGTLQALLDDTRERLAALADPGEGETDQQLAERELAFGMLTGMAQGLMLRLEEIGAEPDKDQLEAHAVWQKAVDAIVEQAHVAAKSHDRADLGTYLHDVLDARFKDAPVPPIPQRFAARYTPAQRDRDIAAVDAATLDLVTLCRERFVVCDTWTIAGTLDSLVLAPLDLMTARARALAAKTAASRLAAKTKKRILAWLTRRLDTYAAWKTEGVAWVLIVGDNKTGRKMDFGGLAYTAQVAAYADAVLYDPETGQRAPYTSLLPADVDPATVRIDVETAIIVHSPVGEGVCRIYDVPLDEGRAAIAMACDVRAMRNDSRNWLQLVHEMEAPRAVEAIEPLTHTATPVDKIADLIAGCHSVEDLLAVRAKHLTPVDYGKPGPDGVHVPRLVVHWNDAHEALAGVKAALLKGNAGQAREALAATAEPDAETDPVLAETDPVLAEIERADTLPLLRGVYAVYKDAWTPQRAAAADAQAAAIQARKAERGAA